MSDGSLNKSSSQGSESVSSTLQVATVLGSSDGLISERVVEERSQGNELINALSSFEGGFTPDSPDDDNEEQEVGEKSARPSAIQIQSGAPGGEGSSAVAGVVGQQSVAGAASAATAVNTTAGLEAAASSESSEVEEETDSEEETESEESQETESLVESDETQGDEAGPATEASAAINPVTVTPSSQNETLEIIDTASLVGVPLIMAISPQEPDIPPVLSPDYASSLLGGRVLIGGDSILANDQDSDSLIQLTSVEGQVVSATGTISLQGQYGELNMHHSGQWSYTSEPLSESARSVASSQLQESLIAHWRFDQVVDDVAIDSAVSGVMQENGVLTAGASVIDSGLYGAAVTFDGLDDQVLVPNSVDINLSSTPLTERTISLAFKLDGNNDRTGHQVLYEEGGSFNGLVIYLEDQKLYAGAYNKSTGWTGHFSSQDISSLSSDHWHHVALVLDDHQQQLRGYLDGEAFTGGAIYGEALSAHSGDISLGGPSLDSGTPSTNLFHDGLQAGGYFKGSIDDVRVYNRALSDAEVEAVRYDLDQVKDVFSYTVSSGPATESSILEIALDIPEVPVSSAVDIAALSTSYRVTSPQDSVLSSFSVDTAPAHAFTVTGSGWRSPSVWGWSTDNVAASGAVQVIHTSVYGGGSDRGYVIELEGYGGDAGNLYKSLPVDAGEHFLVEVDLSARGGVSVSSNQVQLLFEGQAVETLSPSLGFQTYQYLFMASENQPTLEFKAPVNDGVGALLDSVRVYSAEYTGTGSGLEQLSISQGQLDIHEARLLGGTIAGTITSENGFSSLDQWGMLHEGGPLSLSISTTDGHSWSSSYRLFSVSPQGQVGIEVGRGEPVLPESGGPVSVFAVNDLPEGHYLLVVGNQGFGQGEAISSMDYPAAVSGEQAYEIAIQGAASVEEMPRDPAQQASIVDEVYSETQASLTVQVDLSLEEGIEEGAPDRIFQYELYSGEMELGKGGLLFYDSHGTQQVVVTMNSTELQSLSMDDLNIVLNEVNSSGFVLGQQVFEFDTASSPNGEPVVDQDGDGLQGMELMELGLDYFDLQFTETGDDTQAVY